LIEYIVLNFVLNKVFIDKAEMQRLCFSDYNISENGDIVTFPHYLAFVLGKAKYIF